MKIVPRSPPASEDRPAWHAVSAEAALAGLQSSASGLSEDEARSRLTRYGPNGLPEPAGRSPIRIFLAQLASPLIYLLLAAALVALLLGEFTNALFIGLVLTLNSAIGGIQEWRAEAQSVALRSTVRGMTRVIRSGAARQAEILELVPGDIVLLEAGDRVPADIRLLQAAELRADESMLTGESFPIGKSALRDVPSDAPVAERPTMLHAGTMLQTGRAEGLVVATAEATELGRIAKALARPSAEPPLTRRLQRFSRNLGLAVLGFVAVLIVTELWQGASLRETFFVAVALAVSAIPEGLPVAVTVALAIATRRMARRNVIVRHLPAVEGLGSCTVVATDKTGTLTVNALTAKWLWLPEVGGIAVAGEGFDPAGGFTAEAGEPEPALVAVHACAQSAALCNDASYDPRDAERGGSGDGVDVALLVLAVKAGVDLGELRDEAPRVGEIPFAAERRLAVSLNQHADGVRLHAKGAPEVLLPLCTNAGEEARHAVEAMAGRGLRVLALTAKDVRREGPFATEDIEDELSDLRLLALVGLIDPLRPAARAAVADCRRAGVSVRMVTGDHALTALAIARELGIAEDRSDVVTGHDLLAIAANPEERRARIGAAKVFARVEPTQKVDIVETLQHLGHIVAMTGDGVNDAPALRRADLGIAMGRGGTEVAREAADLVLVDDNFASIVAGIEEGRAAYANIRKVIYLLVSTGAAEVVLFLLALLGGYPVPLGAAQLLWLNLVTNGGQDVALAFEKREAGLLDRQPRAPSEPIFDRLMLGESAVSGIAMGGVGFAFLAWAISAGWSDYDARNALLFLMVAFENVQIFNCRSETRSAFRIPFRSNWPLVVAVLGAQTVHIGAAFVPGLRDVLQMHPISPGLWLMLVPIALTLLLVMELFKIAWRRLGKGR